MSSASWVPGLVKHGQCQSQRDRDIHACAGEDLWPTEMPCDSEYTCANWKDLLAQAWSFEQMPGLLHFGSPSVDHPDARWTWPAVTSDDHHLVCQSAVLES